MCGIFGVFQSDEPMPRTDLKRLTETLFRESQNRGQESAGIAIKAKDAILVEKAPVSARQFMRSKAYKSIWSRVPANDPTSLFGHARLVTNGEQGLNHNNQPVCKDGIVLIHNGIVVNIDEAWKKNSHLKREWDIDSEVINALLRSFLKDGNAMEIAVSKTFAEIYGVVNIAAFFADRQQSLLATNNGSLYYSLNSTGKTLIFSSESVFLKNTLARHKPAGFEDHRIIHLPAGSALLFDHDSGAQHSFSIEKPIATNSISKSGKKINIEDIVRKEVEARASMKRCTACILPETFPYISFDSAGVCNYCRSHQKFQLKGTKPLNELATKAKNRNKKYDCLVAFSGGRDSSFGLHYIKNVLGLNPLAYTYDWGMVTDLARRNQSRVCAKLGIEHIIVSADITTKRSYIRKNMNAWLKKPDLGMVPILMAGDKQYFYYANKLARDYDIDLVFFCGNSMEKTSFKSGFCGVQEKSNWFFNVSYSQKFQMAWYYFKQYMINPGYFNSSLWDTLFAYYATYFIPHDYHLLFDYIPWREEEIVSVLKSEFDWEFAGDTDTSWRIGDGTAAFYNYVYHTVAGFSEHDTFRSIQIREGILSRGEALDLAREHNKPRFDSIREYARVIGFDFNNALYAINTIPKLYEV